MAHELQTLFMRLIFIFILLFSKLTFAQERTNYITIMPGSCSNCMAAIDLVSEDNNIFVFMESYAIDSNALRKKYTYLENAKMLFSDKEFKNRSVNGYLMSISNENASMKYDLRAFNKTAYNYFKLWNGKGDDTITYSYPISKQSIYKRVFTPEGKVYLLNSAENNIIVFDLLLNEVLDTIAIPENESIKAYSMNSLSDSFGYLYYHKHIIDHIPDKMCTIEDFTITNDSVFIAVSNYIFVTIERNNRLDTALTKFTSLHLYKANEFKEVYVPSDMKHRFMDSTIKYVMSNAGLYAHNGKLFCRINNKNDDEIGFKYYLGAYEPVSRSMSSKIVFPNDFEGNYNFSSAIFEKNYVMFNKSTKIFNLLTDEVKDLAYFKQSTEDGLFPEYMNYDVVVTDDFYKILYTQKSDDYSVHLATIDRNSNKVISNVKLEKSLTEKSKMFDPFNEDYLIGYKDNFKIIRSKIK